MCLLSLLRCPSCEENIKGIDCLYPCIPKLRHPSSPCANSQVWRYITPTEMVLTTTSCTNIHCAMNVAQQLISQSRIWHAVDVLDAKQMEKSRAEAPMIQRQQRGLIRKHGKVTLSAHIPPISGIYGYSNRPGAVAPKAGTPENLLLRQALSSRRQSMKAVQNIKHAAPDEKASLWDQELKTALDFGAAIYEPSEEDKNTKHDNNQHAAVENEYVVLGYPGAARNLANLDWVPESERRSAEFLQLSASRSISRSNTGESVPASRRKRKASGQTPIESTSTSAMSQLDTDHASIHPPESGRTPGNSSSAVNSASIPGVADTENISSSNASGSASQPGHSVANPSQHSSAPVNAGHSSGRPGTLPRLREYLNFLLNDSNRSARALRYIQPRQRPLRWQTPLTQQQPGFGLPTSEPTPGPSSNTGRTAPDQDSFGQNSLSEHRGLPPETGQMAATQPAFQDNALAYGQPQYAAGNSFSGVSGFHSQPIANVDGPPPPLAQPFSNMGGPPQIQPFATVYGPPPPHTQPVADMGEPPQPGVPTLPQIDLTSAASDIPDASSTQSHDDSDGS